MVMFMTVEKRCDINRERVHFEERSNGAVGGG
jgi:hypothetical protein